MNSTPFVLAAMLAIAAQGATAADAPLQAAAALKSGTGETTGHVAVHEGPGGVVLRVEAKGLTPGWHGLHFHEKGDCSKPDFTSAGAHVHSHSSLVHGLLNPDTNDSGDLPNIFAGADGSATAEVYSPFVSLKGANGKPALLDADGSALVIHANPDDLRSQPIGGAGARVACGVLSPR
jgi:Cu-Zn family superoxide dismutase